MKNIPLIFVYEGIFFDKRINVKLKLIFQINFSFYS